MRKTGKISPEASSVHGITEDMLLEEPDFYDIYDILLEIFEHLYIKTVIYNASFDFIMLNQSAIAHGLLPFNFTPICAMQWYSQWCGDWNEYHQSYKWQRLPGGDHSALGDCLATFEVIEEMAK